MKKRKKEKKRREKEWHEWNLAAVSRVFFSPSPKFHLLAFKIRMKEREKFVCLQKG